MKKMLKKYLSIGLSAFILLQAPTAQAKFSFLDSCKYTVYSGGTNGKPYLIQTYCRKINGTWVGAEFRGLCWAPRNIYNDNGFLNCR